MKFIKTFEEYKDNIGYGDEHVVSEIDTDYVLKEPYHLNAKENFRNHIMKMKAHPNIFADVKLLSKYKASVEKLNTEKAIKDLKYIKTIFEKYVNDITIFDKDSIPYLMLNHYLNITPLNNKMWLKLNPVTIEWIKYVQDETNNFVNNENNIDIVKKDYLELIFIFPKFFYAYDVVNKFLINTKHETCIKFANFFTEIKKELGDNVDAHIFNIGYDKNNNLKLLDF